jgi:uncharacterized membrane protein
MKDKTARLLMILPWLSVPLLVAAHLLLWDSIPERLAVHFDWSGAPDGWMSRGGSLAFDLCVLLFVLCASSWKLSRRAREGSRAQTLAQLALFNVAVVLMTAVFLGVLKYNISNPLF